MKPSLIALFLVFSLAGVAQDQGLSNKMSFGFQVGQYQSEFHIGANVTSPYFAKNSTAIRLRANLAWYQHPTATEMTWSPYSNFSLGTVVKSGEMAGFMRIYGEGGFVLLSPSDEFSNGDPVFGGYGLFGFEFYSTSIFNYFLEIGGVGTGANADKIVGEPIYSNGLIINVGFRFHLGK